MEGDPTKSARSILRHPALLRYALAHHPTCSEFDQDVLVARAGRRRVPLCIGCITFWPILLLGVPAILLVAQPQPPPWWVLFGLGFLLGSVQLLSYARLTRTRRMKVTVKAGFALGAALVVAGIILLPWSPLARIALGLLLIIVALLVQTRRLVSIIAVCDACPWQRDWQYCPGFAPLNDHQPGSRPKAGPPDQRQVQQWPAWVTKDDRP